MTWLNDWLTPVAAPERQSATHWEPDDVARMVDAEPDASDAAVDELLSPDDAVQSEIDVAAREEAAYARGYQDGLTAGAEQAWSRVRAAVHGMEAGLEAWHARASDREAIARENLAALATAIAKHVIGRELRTDARAITDLVRRALAHFPLREPVRIRLNPADLTAISTATDGAVRIATGRSVEWHADADLATGDCIVEAERRVVDGRVDHALERVYTKLIDA